MEESRNSLKIGGAMNKQAFAHGGDDELLAEQPPRESIMRTSSGGKKVNAFGEAAGTRVASMTRAVQVKRNSNAHDNATGDLMDQGTVTNSLNVNGTGPNRVFVGQDTYDAHRRTQSVAKLRNLFAQKFDLPTPSYLQIAVALVVYFLAITEIWRSYPHLKPLKYQKLEPSVYVNDGPNVLPMLTLTKQADKSVTSSLEEIPFSRYKFDTSSLGLRAILALPNQNLNTSWPKCINDYDTKCSTNVEPSMAFDMLDAIAQTTNDNVDKTTTYRTLLNCSALEENSNHLYTCGPLGLLPKRFRFAIRAKARWIMTPSTMLGRFILDRRRWLSTWATQFNDLNNTDPGVNVCLDDSDWPLLCEKPWADFARLAVDPNSVAASVGKLWDEINNQTAALQKKYPSNRIDLTIIESESDPLTHSGGQVIVADKVFNVVLVFRVQSCVAASDPSRSPTCTTFRIDEHRYEGNLLMTDAVEWNFMTTTFRYIGQFFLIFRILCLFIGCFHAVRGTRNADQLVTLPSKLVATLKLFFSLPTQPVVFGSFIPPMFFTAAHFLDGVVVYFVDGDQMQSLTTLLSNDFMEIVRIVSVRMRIVWVIVLLARIVVFFRTSAGWSPARGIVGFRSFLLTSLCFLAIGFAFHDRGIYDSRVLESNEVQAVPTLMALHAETRDGWKSCADGIFDDLWGLLLVVVIYSLASMLCLRVFSLCWSQMNGQRHPQQLQQQQQQQQKQKSQQQPKLQHQHHKSVLFELSEVPYSAGMLWDPSSLVICWEDLFAPVNPQRATSKVSIHSRARKADEDGNDLRSKKDGVSSTALLSVSSCMDSDTTRYVLMNLVFLSDPWHFLNLRMTNSQVHLYELLRYERRRILHPYSKTRFLREFDFQPEDILLLGTFNVVDLAWDQVLFCN